MRKPIILSDIYANIPALLGPGVTAWVYGSVAKGTATEKSDIDIYVSGPRAGVYETKYCDKRPLVNYNGRIYPAHIISSWTVQEEDFLKCQTEAIRVL